MPALDPVTQRFIADVRPYLDSMARLVAETEIATAAVQALIDKINEIPAAKTVTIAVNTVGDTGGTGLGGVAAQAQAATHAIHDLGIVWTEVQAKAAAAAAANAAGAREEAAAAAAAAADAAAQRNLEVRLAAAAAQIERTGRYFSQVVMGARETAQAIDDTANPLEVLRRNLQAVDQETSLIGTAWDGLRATLQAGSDAVAFNALTEANAARAAAILRIQTMAAGDAATQSGAAAGRAWRPWWLLGNNWRTALHWIVAGGGELLAVTIPALIALGAGAFVALQGTQNLQRHLVALYAATESTASAFHTTTGDVLGLKHAFQTAQDAANPGVYELLGSAINDAKTRFADFASTGLGVVHMLDEFSARITVDLKGALGAQLHAFLGSMVTDLQQVGQVLGNFGHALANVFSAMPGLVHILLGTVDAISQFVLWLSKAPAGLLTFGIAMEEVFRWGGLLLGVFARLAGAGGLFTAFAAGGGFITRFGAAIKALVVQGGLGLVWIGGMISKLTALGPAAVEAGAGIQVLGADMAIAGAEMSTGWIVAVVAAAAVLTFLVAKLASAKTATQQWIASSNQMVAKASDLNVLPAIYSQLAATTTRLAASQGTLATHANSVVSRYDAQAGSFKTASQSSVDLANHLMSLVATANTVRSNVNLLAGAFHTSAIGALALANAAGINLQAGMTKGSTALKIAEQQITNLRTGLGAMGAPIGVIGADMEAMGIQSQLAGTKVQQVSQSLDAFVGTLTGGMIGLSQFEVTLHTMGHDALSSSVSLTGAIRSISRSAAQMGFTLQGFGPKAQQSWQQFGQAVNQGQQVLDTFRTGMAEGMVSAGQYNKAILDVAGSLLPFAAHSKTATSIVSALAQQAGLHATNNFKTLAAQLGITGKAAQNQLAAGMQQAIIKMSSMSAVARNLSATVSGQLDAAMAGAIVKASGLDKAYLKWATDVKSNSAAKTLQTDLAGIQKAQNFVNTAEAKGTTLLNNSAKAAAGLGGALKGAAGDAGAFTGKVAGAHAALADVIARARGAAASTQGFGQQARTAAGTAQGLASNASQATTSVKALGTAAGVTRGSLGTVNNEIRTTATAASGARGPLGTMSSEISNVGAHASTAAGQVHALASAMAGLQSKTVTLTTNMVTVTSTIHRQHGGPVFPGVPYTVGEAGRELFVPSGAGLIVPHQQTERMLSPVASPAPAASGPSGAAGAAGGPHTLVIQMNGREVARALLPELWRWQVRNSGKVTGIIKPS